MTTSIRRWIALSLGAAALLFAGCSDDNGAEPDDAHSTTKSSSDPTSSATTEESDAQGEADARNPGQRPHEKGSEDFLFDQAAIHTFSIDVDDDLLAEIDADPTPRSTSTQRSPSTVRRSAKSDSATRDRSARSAAAPRCSASNRRGRRRAASSR